MPKSRRDRAIAFTKTTKKQGLEPKEKTIETVRSLVDQYERIFVYSLDNSRNNHLKDLRTEFKSDSRLIFFSIVLKNIIIQILSGKEQTDPSCPGQK